MSLHQIIQMIYFILISSSPSSTPYSSFLPHNITIQNFNKQSKLLNFIVPRPQLRLIMFLSFHIHCAVLYLPVTNLWCYSSNWIFLFLFLLKIRFTHFFSIIFKIIFGSGKWMSLLRGPIWKAFFGAIVVVFVIKKEFIFAQSAIFFIDVTFLLLFFLTLHKQLLKIIQPIFSLSGALVASYHIAHWFILSWGSSPAFQSFCLFWWWSWLFWFFPALGSIFSFGYFI